MVDKGRILVVDDSYSSCELVKAILEKEAYSVHIEQSGESALFKIDTIQPDIVLLDLWMPGMNGFEVCKILKEDVQTKEIPVIFLSATSDTDEKVKGFHLGAVDFISKPFEQTELLARVQTHLQINQMRLQLKMQAKKLANFNEQLEKEIRQNKKAEEHLHKFILGIENTNDAIFITNVNGEIEYINAAFEKIYGYSSVEAIGKTPRILKSGLLTREDYAFFWNTLLSKKSTSGEIINKTKDGRRIPIEETTTPIINNEDEIIGFISINRDISERKELLEAVQKEKKLLRTLIDIIPDAIYIKDELGRKMVSNKADLKLMNAMDESEIVGKTDLELLSGKFAEMGYTDDMRVLKTGVPILLKEDHLTAANGETFWLLSSKIPIKSSEGKVTGLVGIGSDITRRKKTNEQIIKLSTALKQSPLSIIITDTKGNIEYVNPKLVEITGYCPEELIGKNTRIFKSDEKTAKEYKELWETISSGKEWHGEFRDRKKNGELYWESASISPVRNEEGEIINYIAIKEDITHQKQLMIELLHSKEKAEESDRLKSAFLANMSHEIRTPMNSIMGFASLLPEEESKELLCQYAHIIVQNSEQLVHIIDDIVLFSNLQAKKYRANISEFDLNILLNQLIQSFSLPDYLQTIELKLEKNIASPFMIKADNEKIKQILTNIIANAFKYTSAGSITIGAKVQNEQLLLFVKDTGIGIPADEREKVFDRFFRGSNTRKETVPGTGLGLSIVKELAEVLKGKIWVESVEGKGSTFWFSIKCS